MSEKAREIKDGLWIIDQNGTTVFVSEVMAEILGAPSAAILGLDSFTFVFPEDVPAAQQLFASKQGGSKSPFRFRLRRFDGTATFVSVQGTPLHNAAGEFLGIVGTFTPVPAFQQQG